LSNALPALKLRAYFSYRLLVLPALEMKIENQRCVSQFCFEINAFNLLRGTQLALDRGRNRNLAELTPGEVLSWRERGLRGSHES
jgi:hypothetical protein